MQSTDSRLRLPLATLVILALALVGCFRESDDNTMEGTDTSPGETAVEVLITDDEIQMPEEIAAGAVMFEVTNGGGVNHGFAIEGVEGSLDSLNPDALDTLRTELEPGTYTVFSPVGTDREDGLERELTVTGEANASGAPLGDEGIGPSEEQQPVEEDGG